MNRNNDIYKEYDYPTGQKLQYVVVIMSNFTRSEGDDEIRGGVVVGPFSERKDSIDFIEEFHKNHPKVAAKQGVLGSAQLLSPEEFKAAVADRQRLADLKGQLHS